MPKQPPVPTHKVSAKFFDGLIVIETLHNATDVSITGISEAEAQALIYQLADAIAAQRGKGRAPNSRKRSANVVNIASLFQPNSLREE